MTPAVSIVRPRHPSVQWCLDGTFRPLGERVLVYAVMPADGTAYGTGMEATRGADYYEVRAVGAAVPHGYVEVGDRIQHVSASSDPVDPTDTTCRWMLVDYRDITGRHAPPVVVAPIDKALKALEAEGKGRWPGSLE